ncbi:MAG: WXG100 family type VII secretion target [Chloroflexi bacterium]|nr:WXG100 family type VII secretion target [Chloroflexota bacterium]
MSDGEVRFSLSNAAEVDRGYQHILEEMESMRSILQSSADNVLETWFGNSKNQFLEAWNTYTSTVNTLTQRVEELRTRLNSEAREIDSTFSGFGGSSY